MLNNEAKELTPLKELVDFHQANLVRLILNGDIVDEWDVGSPEYSEREEWYVVGDSHSYKDPNTMATVLIVHELTQTFEGETQMNQILDVEVDVALVQKATLQVAHKKLKRRDIPRFIDNAKKSSGLNPEDLMVVVADWDSRKLEINQVE
tara:strand:- start:59 stop:508 length:450 start_codon:yes stop_codon:yes gene_type:complete